MSTPTNTAAGSGESMPTDDEKKTARAKIDADNAAAKVKADAEIKHAEEARIEAEKVKQTELDSIEADRVAEQKKLTDAHKDAVEQQGYTLPTDSEEVGVKEAPKAVSARWRTIEDLNDSEERLQVMPVNGGLVLRSIIVDDEGITSQAMILMPDYEIVGPENIIRHI